MATVTWIDTNGNWTSGANWSTGSPPGPDDDAVIANGGRASVTTSIVVNSITTSGSSGVDVADSGGTVTISGNVIAHGRFDVDQTSGGGGSTVNIGGTLDYSGGILYLGNAALDAPTTITAAGLSGVGDLSLYGNLTDGTTNQATLDISASAPASLGTTFIEGDALLEFASGEITSVAAGTQVLLVGVQARIALAADSSSNSALTGLSSNSGEFNLEDHAAVSTSSGVDLTNSGSLTLDGGASLSLGGALTNSNFIELLTLGGLGTVVGTASGTTTITATSLSNTGFITLDGNAPDASQAIIDITGAAPTSWTGTLLLGGNALLEFGSGGIGTIASGGSIKIDGPNAHIALASDTSVNSALAGLTSNAGMLDLEAGTTLSLDAAGTLSNTGQITLDGVYGGNSTLNTGILNNAGTITAGSDFNNTVTSTITASALTNTSTGRITLFGDSAYSNVTVGPTMTVTGTTTNSNVIELIAPAILDLRGAVSGIGKIILGDSLTTLEFGAAVGSGQTVALNTGNLKLDDPGAFAGTISGLTVGSSSTTPTNEIDLTTIASGSITGAGLDTTSDVLTVDTTGSGTIALLLSGTYAAGTFVDWTADSAGNGSDVFLSTAACYCRGTLILTRGGEMPVEELAIGDRVSTFSGEARPIKWIGRRSYDGRFVRNNRKVLPIVIAAGALADGVPARDLWLSPNHALLLDSVLVQAKHLVNGMSIVQSTAVETVEYFHLELETHDVIFAERAPAETYVDCDNRGTFHNAAEFAALYPEDCRPRWGYSAPLVETGDALAALRRRLLERAAALGWGLSSDPDLRLVADGRPVAASQVEGTLYTFALAQPACDIRIVSRHAVPRAIGINDDARRLGVALRSITLRSPTLTLAIAYDEPRLSEGFHDPESPSHRWSDGDARLPACFHQCFDGTFTVEIDALALASYPVFAKPSPTAAIPGAARRRVRRNPAPRRASAGARRSG